VPQDSTPRPPPRPLPPPPDAWTAARRYVAAGLSVIPVRCDGTKAPAMKGWREFAARFPSEVELRRWFAVPYYGVGIVCGPASGNLVVWDFEDGAVFTRWAQTPAAALVLARCPVVVTPSGGRHVYVRLPAGAQPGRPVARNARGDLLVEVRGDGHQVVAPGSPAKCHRLNKPYLFERAGWLAGVFA
jgi:hypothetical protein